MLGRACWCVSWKVRRERRDCEVGGIEERGIGDAPHNVAY